MSAKRRARQSKAFALRISLSPVVAASPPVFSFVSRSLRVAVGADQPDVIESVVRRVTVFMIKLKRRGPVHPFRDAANFTTPATHTSQIVS